MKDKIIGALQRATGDKNIHLEFPENEEFGDYSSNIAMAMFSNLKFKIKNLKLNSPRELAQALVNKLQKDKQLSRIVERTEVAGPGFINFWLSKEALVGQLEEVLSQKDKYGSSKTGIGKTVVIDYSSPNIAKRFSIGHLRSTVIGQALYNLYKFTGWNTIGDNHLGDWGTQFGVLIYMIERERLDPKRLSVSDWEKLYIDFHKELETDKDLENVAAEAFKCLENGDSSARKIWQAAFDTSLKEYNRIYEILGVKIDYAYGESSYEDQMPDAIKKAKEKGILVKSKGAWVIEFDKKYNLPSNVLVKSNGATTYLTRDLALLFFRKEKWNPDLQIFEVGAEQSLYFKQVFAMSEMMGLFRLDQLKHIAHGLIRFPHGKMSTRRGQTVKLEDVLEEAVRRARKIIDSSVTGRDLGNKEKEEISQKVGIGAVKYFDLSHHPTSDIVFDWEKMFVLEGNSAPYLQYTVARTNSVLAKVKSQNSKLKAINHLTIQQFNHEEELVLRGLSRFSEVIASAAKNYSPNLLANYLFDLAQKYNNFYNQHRIIGSDNLELRLGLTTAVGQVLKNGLTILGIQAPERM